MAACEEGPTMAACEEWSIINGYSITIVDNKRMESFLLVTNGTITGHVSTKSTQWKYSMMSDDDQTIFCGCKLTLSDLISLCMTDKAGYSLTIEKPPEFLQGKDYNLSIVLTLGVFNLTILLHEGHPPNVPLRS